MKTKVGLFLLAIGFIFNSQNIASQGKLVFLLEGSYSAVKGGFNGEDMLVGGGEGFLIPKLEGNMGFGISLGSFNKNTYGGFKYARYSYDATSIGVSLGKANQNVFGLEYKFFFSNKSKDLSLERPKIQFFILAGIELGILNVENGYVNASSTSLGDASFRWLGAPIGMGIAINPVKKFSIDLGVSYRLAMITGVKEVGSSEEPLELEDNLGMGGIVCDVGLNFFF